jgi:hypothetical protein
MKLFGLKDTRSNRVVAGAFFKAKPDAKRERDALNKDAESAKAFVVTYGPDHRKYKAAA